MTFPPKELLVERVFNSSFFIPTARFKYLLAVRSIMVEEVGVEPTMRWKWSMPGAGIEPTLPEGKEILSLMCLPIPPSGRWAQPATPFFLGFFTIRMLSQ